MNILYKSIISQAGYYYMVNELLIYQGLPESIP